MGKYRALKFHAYKLIRPVPSTSRGKCNADQNLEDTAEITDGGPTPDIFPHSHSYHVPLFILTISLVEIIIFVYHTISLSHNHKITSYGPIPYCSVLIYNPFRRYEVWRLLTYVFVHCGWVHIACNVGVQIMLGCPLEIVHGPIRVAAIYLAGSLTGSLLTSVTESRYYLAGASGGAYALLLAHLPTLVLNWRDMKTFFEWIYVTVVLSIGLTDFGFSIYESYSHFSQSSVGMAAHIGGAMGGFLVGINVVRNFHAQAWEGYLRLASILIWLMVVIICILVNAFGKFYPVTDWNHLLDCL